VPFNDVKTLASKTRRATGVEQTNETHQTPDTQAQRVQRHTQCAECGQQGTIAASLTRFLPLQPLVVACQVGCHGRQSRTQYSDRAARVGRLTADRLPLECPTSLEVDDLTAIESAALVVLATAGSTNSVRTINAHLLTYGEQPSGVVILERRYGPRRLRDDDDDDSK